MREKSKVIFRGIKILSIIGTQDELALVETYVEIEISV